MSRQSGSVDLDRLARLHQQIGDHGHEFGGIPAGALVDLRSVRPALGDADDATVYQRTNGRLGAQPLWFPAALLTTTGRRSGTPRTTATLCVRDGDEVILPVSFRGRNANPLWYPI